MAEQRAVASVSGGPATIDIPEADILNHAGMRRTAAGAAVLFDDANTTGLTIGGGAGMGTIAISAGGSADLDLTARGATTPLNEAGQVSLDAGFAAASIIGALNELKTSPTSSTLQQAYEAGNTITTDAANGQLNFSGTESIALSSSSATANAIGLTASDSAGGVQVNSGSSGTVDINGGTAAGGTTIDGFTVSIGGVSTTGTIDIGTVGAAQTLNFGTGAGVKTTTVGSTNTTSSTTVQGGASGTITITTGDEITVNSDKTTGRGIHVVADSSGADAVVFDVTSGGIDLNLATSNASSGNFNLDCRSLIVTTGATTTNAVLLDTGVTGGIELNAGTQGILLTSTGVINLTTSSGVTTNTVIVQATATAGQVRIKGGTGTGGDVVLEATNISIGSSSTTDSTLIGNTLGTSNLRLRAGSTAVDAIDMESDGGIYLDAGGKVTLDSNISSGTAIELLTVQAGADILFDARSSTSDIIFDARSMSTRITLNQTDDVDLEGFPDASSTRTITSIIGAFNFTNRIVAFVEDVDLTTTGLVNLFTVPSGKLAVVTGAYVVAKTANTVTGAPEVSFVWSGGGTAIQQEALTGLDSASENYRMTIPNIASNGPAGELLRLSRDVAGTATALTADIIVTAAVIDA